MQDSRSWKYFNITGPIIIFSQLYFSLFLMEKQVWSIWFLQTTAVCFSDSIKICLMQIVPVADVPAKLGRENVQRGHKEDGFSLCSAKILADHHWACPDVKFQLLSILFLYYVFHFLHSHLYWWVKSVLPLSAKQSIKLLSLFDFGIFLFLCPQGRCIVYVLLNQDSVSYQICWYQGVKGNITMSGAICI